MIAAHLASAFKVYVLGFMPGLAYIAGLEPSLYLPRRSQPRVRLPRSSVAIAMDMTTIYPFESPGGWHLIGRTPLWMFDKRREQPVFLAPGDLLTFQRIDRKTYDRDRARGRSRHARLGDAGEGMSAALKVVARRPVRHRAGSRPHRLHGARHADRRRDGPRRPHASPMRWPAIPPSTAGLEIGVMGPDLLVEADSVRIALVGPLSPSLIEGPDAPPKPLESDRSHLLKRGQVLRVGMVEGSSTAYLAVAGGFALPPFMGSLSTYARAGIGGFDGRKLAAGDVLPLKREQRAAGRRAQARRGRSTTAAGRSA